MSNKAKFESIGRIAKFKSDVYRLWFDEQHQDLTLQEFRIALTEMLYSSLTKTHRPKKKDNGKT